MSGKDLIDGLENLRATEGWKVRETIDRLNMSFYIFNINHNDMVEVITLFQRKDVGNAMLKVAAEHQSKQKLEGVFREIVRRLHNFVAAAKTLVDHTRIIANELYVEKDFLLVYEKEVKERFVDNPLVQFVHNLRNYILHVGLPVALITYSLDGETGEMNNSITVDIEKLRAWKGWTGVSRRYVDEAKRNEELEQIIKTYTATIVDFHQWFYKKNLEFHAEAFEQTEKLREEIKKKADELGFK